MSALRHRDRIDRLRPPQWHHAGIQLKRLAEQLRSEGLEAEGVLLDLGCGGRPYAPLFPRVDYVGIDLSKAHGEPDLLAGAESLPLRDASVDIVLSTQQLEHVVDPDRVLSEAHRVLRPGGRLLLSTHGVWVHHPDPVDLWRWTEEGLRTLVADHGFEIERSHRQGELVAAAAVLLTYPFSAKVIEAGPVARILRPVLSAVQLTVGLLDRLTARVLPRHFASPSYLVIASKMDR